MRRATLYYLLFAGLLFSPFFFLGRVFVPGDVLWFIYPWRAYQESFPQNLELFDVTVFFYPQDVFFNAALKSGEFPLWNPYIFGGHPVVSSGQSGFHYPLRILFHWIFSVGVAKTWLQFLHLFGMGVAMRYFFRSRGYSDFPSTLGGLAWMGNSYVLSWLEFEHVPIAGFYLPLMLIAFEKGLSGSKTGWLGLALTGALTLHSGHLQIVTYVGLIFGLYVLSRLVRQRPKAIDLAGLGISSVLALALAAPTVLPFLEFLADSQRVPLHPRDNAATLTSTALSLLCPDLYGNPALGFMFNRCRSNLIYPEFACFVGSIPLLYALSARGREARILQVACLAVLLLAAAVFSITLPLLDRFVPGRILLILVFLLTYLAVMGAEQSRSSSDRLKKTAVVLALLWAGAFAVAAYHALNPQAVWSWAQANPGALKLPPAQSGPEVLSQALSRTYLLNPQMYLPFLGYGLLCFRPQKHTWLLLFTLLELGLFGFRFNPSVPPDALFPTPPEIQAMQASEGRVVSIRCANYNTLTPYGLRRINGYESLVDRRYGLAVSQAEPDRALSMRSLTLERLEAPILDALALQYALLPPQAAHPGEGWVLHFTGRGGTVWRNEDAMPRAFLVGEVRPLGSPEALRELEPSRFAYSSSAPPNGFNLRAGAGHVRVLAEGANYLTLEVESETDQFLVLTDTYRSGWRCLVDGQEAEVVQANLASRGVFLNAGQNRVEFRFLPDSYSRGLRLAAGGGAGWLLLLLSILLARVSRFSRRSSRSGSP